MQASAIRVYSFIAERSRFYPKTVQASAIRVYTFIAECSRFYPKTVQASAIRVHTFIIRSAMPDILLHLKNDMAGKPPAAEGGMPAMS